MFGRSVHLLLIEDDEVDAEAIVRAFQRQKIANLFTIVPDGVEALNTLRGAGGYEPLSRPYLILLDLNLPRMNGLEFLQALRQDTELKRSIVFVLTTSRDSEDVRAAYDWQVAGYLLKSKTGEDFIHLIALLDYYWHLVEFPPEGS